MGILLSYRLARPVLRLLDPEMAHGVTIWALKSGLVAGRVVADDPMLACRVWDLAFSNPIGLAAGCDKDAEVMDAMLGFGFGFVEAGTVTPLPQPGNPKPRLFRLYEDEGVINRFGFNSKGLAAFVNKLKRRQRNGIVGANVGKNRDAMDAPGDYATGIAAVCGLADYLVCNISSPNTPGLRGLQGREQIEALLTRVLEVRSRAVPHAARLPPLLAKVGPDLTENAVRDIAEVALATKIDGLIVGNTTIDRRQSAQRVPQRSGRAFGATGAFRPCTATPRGSCRSWVAAVSPAVPMPIPRYARVRRWCNCIRHWYFMVRNWSAASSANSRSGCVPMASRRCRRQSVRIIAESFFAAPKGVAPRAHATQAGNSTGVTGR